MEGEKERVCQEAHSFCWAPSGSGKVDKQWRESHPFSFLKPEQTHMHYNAWAPSPPILCCTPSIVRDWVLSIVGQILRRSVRQTKGRGEKKNGGELQATMRNTNEMMAGSHPSTRPGLTPFNLVKSAPKSKHSPLVSWQRKESDSQSHPKRKLLWNWMRGYGGMQHCARHADYYSWGTLLYFKKSICIHSACKRSSGATLAAAPAAFEFLTIFFRPFWHAIYYSSSRNLYYPLWGNCPCSKSAIITKTISIQCKSTKSYTETHEEQQLEQQPEGCSLWVWRLLGQSCPERVFR